MSLFSENVIPGNLGKVFGTNAKEPQTLEKIKSPLELIDGVKDVIIHLDVNQYTEDILPLVLR